MLSLMSRDGNTQKGNTQCFLFIVINRKIYYLTRFTRFSVCAPVYNMTCSISPNFSFICFVNNLSACYILSTVSEVFSQSHERLDTEIQLTYCDHIKHLFFRTRNDDFFYFNNFYSTLKKLGQW